VEIIKKNIGRKAIRCGKNKPEGLLNEGEITIERARVEILDSLE